MLIAGVDATNDSLASDKVDPVGECVITFLLVIPPAAKGSRCSCVDDPKGNSLPRCDVLLEEDNASLMRRR